MKPIRVPDLAPEQLTELKNCTAPPARAAQDSRPDGSSGRRAALHSGADRPHRPRSEETVSTLAQALPRRGVRGVA